MGESNSANEQIRNQSKFLSFLYDLDSHNRSSISENVHRPSDYLRLQIVLDKITNLPLQRDFSTRTLAFPLLKLSSIPQFFFR